MELLSTNNLRPLLTLSTGLFAGLGISISYVAAPAILASKDPLGAWREVYKRGSKLALGSIFFTTATSITCYLNSRREFGTGDSVFLLVAGASMFVPPFTIILMKPINDTLFRINDKSASTEDVKDLVVKWSNLQWVRTAVGVGVFVYTVYNLGRK